MNEYDAINNTLNDPFFLVGGFNDYKIKGGKKEVDLEKELADTTLMDEGDEEQSEDSESVEKSVEKKSINGGSKCITQQQFKQFLLTFNKFM